MHQRAAFLINQLKLQAHPEGGFFSSVFLAPSLVLPEDGRPQRSAFSVIYFLLVAGTFSRWHQVLSDEAWHFYEGMPLELLQIAPQGGSVATIILGPLASTTTPVHIVPARWWQAARPLGEYALVGCSLGPAFDYNDFTLLQNLPVSERPIINPQNLLTEFL